MSLAYKGEILCYYLKYSVMCSFRLQQSLNLLEIQKVFENELCFLIRCMSFTFFRQI